ncbi:hypothetical protein HHE02_07610 [Helicobacter heilmannii]|uniref:SPOR domain-containing protein n=1 Tax=Helicobacter heilmannii TaxID=35817 RepID=UPI0006A1F75B|nr:SPOR domain-containing protein [Helicobacter heilmannii]CRF47470.1 hypothetical protein HHE02_07610 [Helicobacter heilmannii]CRF49899.1 hypothetical protein HHE03_15790 [Helicobacter heilmannii]
MDNKNEFGELDPSLRRHVDAVLEEEQKSSGFKKILLMVAIVLIVLVVVVVVFYKSTREPAKSASVPPEKNMQKVGNAHDFESLTLEPSVKKPEEDRFDQIVKDIQSKQNQPTANTSSADSTDNKLSALPASPLDKPAHASPLNTPLHQTPRSEHGAEHLTHEEAHHGAHEKSAQAHTQTHQVEHKPAHPVHNAHAEHKPAHPVHKLEHKPERIAHNEHKTIHPTAHTPAKHPTPPTKHPAKADLPKGFYLQVGVFSKTPNEKFLEAIKPYPHKVQDFHGQKRYLIGPFESQEKADKELEKVSKDVAKPVHVQIK